MDLNQDLKLRQDLQLIQGEADEHGEAAWLLYDRARHSFFRLGWQEVEILRELALDRHITKNAEQFSNDVTHKVKANISTEKISDFIEFLTQNSLLECRTEDQRAFLMNQQHAKKVGPFKKLINSYLFVKIPLVHPNRLLDKLVPFTGWLFHRYTVLLLSIITVIGFYLMMRQWNQFTSSVSGLLSPSGLVTFFIALAFVKILHELGHALAAKRFGCSVPTLGLAFMVFWPVLYTDTTDAWRLKSKEQRLWIGAAGIIVELAIAVMCLVAWNLLPPGLLKNVCFLLATTTWIMTLAVNLNPLMRFDGYFLLSDWMGVDNLQSRAFALGRWRLRTWLVGLRETPPEHPRTSLIMYAYGAWLYRLVLFAGISWIIYEFFFKALGILLVMFYVFNALLKPVGKELLYYAEQRQSMKLFPNAAITLSCFAALIALFFVPISSSIVLPGYMNATNPLKLYAPVDGKLLTIPTNDRFYQEQEVLFALQNPDIDQEIELIELEIQSLRWQLEHHSLSDGRLQPLARIQSELLVVLDKLAALKAVQSNNVINASISGTLKDLSPDIREGDWIAKGTELATLVSFDGARVYGYISERDLDVISIGNEANFYGDGGTKHSVNLKLTEIESVAIDTLDEPYNASVYGGELNVQQIRDSHNGTGALAPIEATYRLTFETNEAAPQRILSGAISLDASPRSIFTEVKNRFLGVWRREAGF